MQRLGDGWLEKSSNFDDSLRYSLAPFERRLKCSYRNVVLYFSVTSLQSDDLERKCSSELVSARSRDGGLRFGEMERDAVIAHGSSAMLKERLFAVSDPFQITVCQKCGIMTSTTKDCHICKGDQVTNCNFPYASKLLHQELTAMGLKVIIRPDEK